MKTYIDDHSKQSIKLNNINVVKLKDKLGTRQLPTAEMILEGTIAEIASPRGKGLNYIMQLANITRLHNIFNSLGYMRGMISLIEDFSYKRKVFNDFLSNKPLHIAALSNMKKNFEGNLVLGLYVSKLQGIIDYYLNNPSTTNGVNYDTFTQSQQLLRCILPLIKIFTAINSEHICLEGIQCFGAFGYLEDSMIPQLLRDTIVTSIWEGTVNTLCIEFMKSMRDEKTRKSLIILMDKNLRNIFSSEEKTRVQESIGYVKCIIEDIKSICLVQSNFKAILDSELIYREFSLL